MDGAQLLLELGKYDTQGMTYDRCGLELDWGARVCHRANSATSLSWEQLDRMDKFNWTTFGKEHMEFVIRNDWIDLSVEWSPMGTVIHGEDMTVCCTSSSPMPKSRA